MAGKAPEVTAKQTPYPQLKVELELSVRQHV